MPRTKGTSHTPASFLQKTFDILSEASLSSVVSWSGDGNSFAVQDVKGFSEQVLPKYFKHCNFPSFVRQLNMYGFHKLRDQDNAFAHPQFQRDKQAMLKDILRKSSEIPPSKAFLSMADCSGLLAKLYSLHAHQQDLEALVLSLQGKYRDIRAQNQMLINELVHAQMREQRIEELLVDLAAYITKLQTTDFSAERRMPFLALPSPDPELDFLEELKEDPLDFFFSSHL